MLATGVSLVSSGLVAVKCNGTVTIYSTTPTVANVSFVCPGVAYVETNAPLAAHSVGLANIANLKLSLTYSQQSVSPINQWYGTQFTCSGASTINIHAVQIAGFVVMSGVLNLTAKTTTLYFPFTPTRLYGSMTYSDGKTGIIETNSTNFASISASATGWIEFAAVGFFFG